jgi:hypothetical protein
MREGWLLAELEQRFGFGLEELARQFDRSVSWVSRRLALVELLPNSVQQQVRTGEGLRAGGDEVFGAGGAWQPGRLPTDSGGFRAAQVHQPASRAAVRRLARGVASDPGTSA